MSTIDSVNFLSIIIIHKKYESKNIESRELAEVQGEI